MPYYIATHKGRTAGMFPTQRAAADDFFNKYQDERKCVVASCEPGPHNTVIYPFGSQRIEVTRKTVSSLLGEPLWR